MQLSPPPRGSSPTVGEGSLNLVRSPCFSILAFSNSKCAASSFCFNYFPKNSPRLNSQLLISCAHLSDPCRPRLTVRRLNVGYVSLFSEKFLRTPHNSLSTP